MSNSKKLSVAICYDFDGTLIRGNMQENSFIPDLGMKEKSFWREVKKKAKSQDMDEVLAYMELMVEKARQRDKPFNRETLRKHGKGVSLFPGVKNWFQSINGEGARIGLAIDHYVISSGIDEMIIGSPIGGHFKHVFASGFSYDANGVPKFAARGVNYTTKTQYLFRINKGIPNSWDSRVNAFMDDSKRPNPFSRMIYLGDGETDIPVMKMLNYQGGYSIAVYPPPAGQIRTREENKKMKVVKKMHEENRTQFIADADYRKSSKLSKIVTTLLQRIADEERYGLNRKA